MRLLVALGFAVNQLQNLVCPISRIKVKLGSSSHDGLGVGFATQTLQLWRHALLTSSSMQYVSMRLLATLGFIVSHPQRLVFPLLRIKVKLESSSHGPSGVGARVGERVGGRVGERVGGGGGVLPP
mmetsp:Transcript_5445/g.10370  ORF Transcript_5445/g.10370 Transcript_5445/m.10370 type:complete len:126 (-) Transcript_5445:5489-5866(-)